jgi:hypothetical protein
MAFLNMWSEIVGSVPKIPRPFAKTLVNRAWKDVRRKNLWSFLMFDGRWISPPLINAGTVTVTQGSTSVVADAVAAAAILAGSLSPTLITQRQLRAGLSGVYNIVAWDTVDTLTLDHAWAEPSAVGSAYSIFQCYYPPPMKDFLTWVSVRDMVNFNALFTTRLTRQELDQSDPQRMWFGIPSDVVFFGADGNLAGLTPGWPLFEIWGHPQFEIAWQLYGIRRGTDLVADTDELPPAVGEDCVLALARKYAYEWAEANKGDAPRNAGPDFRFLIGGAEAEYQRLFREYRKDDREMVDNYFARLRGVSYPQFLAHYNTLSATASPGGAISW